MQTLLTVSMHYLLFWMVVGSLAYSTPLYAGQAWDAYQNLKAQHKQQNQQNWDDFRAGKKSAEDLQHDWEQMDREAHDAAERAHDEMRNNMDKQAQQTRQQYEQDQATWQKEADKRRQQAQDKMDLWEREAEHRRIDAIRRYEAELEAERLRLEEVRRKYEERLRQDSSAD